MAAVWSCEILNGLSFKTCKEQDMVHHPILVNGEWREASFPVSSFKAINPISGKQLPDSFPVSSFLDIDEMLQAEKAGRESLQQVSFTQRSDFLQALCDALKQNAEELCQTAHIETGLNYSPFLVEQEFSIMLQQLDEAAKFCLNRTWRDATIDTRSNVRSIRGPLPGPVVIFGPACNPFSLNSCGGNDFACAIVSGNSIIAKANPALPLTSYKLAKIISQIVSQLELPGFMFQFFFDTTSDLGLRLAAHPMIGAIAFTGSKKAGMLLKESADHAGNLSFIGMSGPNPVVLLPGAVNEQKNQIARQLSDSVRLNEGQTCHKPGIVFLVENKESSTLIRAMVDEFNAASSKPLLSDVTARNLDSQLSHFIRLGARKITRKEFYQPTPFLHPYTILHLDIKTWLQKAAQLQDEAFGPAILFVTLENDTQFAAAVNQLDNLNSLSLYSDISGADDNIYRQIAPLCRQKCARLLDDRLPSPFGPTTAQASGGCFPASNQPGFGFFGMPAAIKRFTAIHCYDNVRQTRLPEDLQIPGSNPHTIRSIDGKYSDQ